MQTLHELNYSFMLFEMKNNIFIGVYFQFSLDNDSFPCLAVVLKKVISYIPVSIMGLALLLNCLLVTWPPFVVYSMPNNSYIYLIELFYFIQQSSFKQDFFLQLSAFCLIFHAHSHSNEHIRSSSGFNDSPKNTLAYRLKQPRIEQLTFQLAEVWFCVLTKLLCIHLNFIDNYLYNI